MSVVNPLKKGATLEQLRRVQEYEDGKIDELKTDIGNLEALLRTIQEKLNSGSSSVDTVTVNEINDMIVEYFENKTVSEVEA